MSQNYSKAELDRVRGAEKLLRRVPDHDPLPPHPDSQSVEGHRRARLSAGKDNLAHRLEFLQFGEELGWPKLPYGKPQNSPGVFKRGQSVKAGQESWEGFAKFASFSRLAPALRIARVRVEYRREVIRTGQIVLDDGHDEPIVGGSSDAIQDRAAQASELAAIVGEWIAEPKRTYPNLEKARAAKVAKKEAEHARLRLS